MCTGGCVVQMASDHFILITVIFLVFSFTPTRGVVLFPGCLTRELAHPDKGRQHHDKARIFLDPPEARAQQHVEGFRALLFLVRSGDDRREGRKKKT